MTIANQFCTQRVGDKYDCHSATSLSSKYPQNPNFFNLQKQKNLQNAFNLLKNSLKEGLENPKSPSIYKGNPFEMFLQKSKKGRFLSRQLAGRTNERTNERTDERTNGRTNERTFSKLLYPKTKPLVLRGNKRSSQQISFGF